MFNIIPLPWCFFLSGVGRAPHPPPPRNLIHHHPGIRPRRRKTMPRRPRPIRQSGSLKLPGPVFWEFWGVRWSWKKKEVSHPPKVQPIVPKFLVDFVELKLHWLVEEKCQYILSKTGCFFQKRLCWFFSIDSIEQWTNPWLFGVYRGLYYPLV